MQNWVARYKVGGYSKRELRDGSPLKQEHQRLLPGNFKFAKMDKASLSCQDFIIIICIVVYLDYSAFFTCSLFYPCKSHSRRVLMISHLGKLPSSQPWSTQTKINIASPGMLCFFPSQFFLSGFFFFPWTCWPHVLNKLHFQLAHPSIVVLVHSVYLCYNMPMYLLILYQFCHFLLKLFCGCFCVS